MASGVNDIFPDMKWWPALLLATGCACAPTYHDETTYAPPAMQQQIELCAAEGSCTLLCARAFFLEAGTIDSCRILERDGSGGATLKVEYHEYVCAADDFDIDIGADDYSGDDPCSDGSCDPPPDEDPPPDDPPPDEDPPPDDPPPDDPPPDDPM